MVKVLVKTLFNSLNSSIWGLNKDQQTRPKTSSFFHTSTVAYLSDPSVKHRISPFSPCKPSMIVWLGAEKIEVLQTIPLIWERVEGVNKVRSDSPSAPTQKLAEKPTRFHVENMPKSNYLVVPKVSSERRAYIPIGFMDSSTLSSDFVFIIANASLFHFSILTSKMHMTWVKYVCGRLKSDTSCFRLS